MLLMTVLWRAERKTPNRLVRAFVCSNSDYLVQLGVVFFFFSLTFGYPQLISSIMEQRQFQLQTERQFHNCSFKLLPFIHQNLRFFPFP